MNSQTIKTAASALVLLLGAKGSASSAEEILFSKSLTAADRHCLQEILRTGHWHIMPEFHQEMIAAAVVARADLKGSGQKQYIFVITDFASCGTAGCSMLIGERKGGICHEIYGDAGSDVAITVLRKRDHGYRRLYTPCEVRFDGHQYRHIHEECPNDAVRR